VDKYNDKMKDVLLITMNRPDLHNAFNEVLISEMTSCFSQIPSSTRAIVLNGNGKSFSAGADLNWMKKMINYNENENKKDSLSLFDMFYAIKTAPVPVICRVNGHAMGGGCGIVAACDYAYSINTAAFGFTEVKLGLIPAVISPFVISKIGSKASKYFLTGERFNSSIAKSIGLIEDHYENFEQLDKEIEKQLDEILKSSPEAIKSAKLLIQNVSPLKIQSLRDYVASEIAKIRVSKQGQEGLTAFLDKRPPSWINK